MAGTLTADALLAAIAAADGPRDFPARIGMTAAALREQAATRLATAGSGATVLATCRALLNGEVASSSAAAAADGGVAATGKLLTEEDARIIAFCLARSDRPAGLE